MGWLILVTFVVSLSSLLVTPIVVLVDVVVVRKLTWPQRAGVLGAGAVLAVALYAVSIYEANQHPGSSPGSSGMNSCC